MDTHCFIHLKFYQLIEGIDGFMKKLKKMPKPVKALTPAIHLEAKMREFKEAVPLFLDLKNEALRERCFCCTSFIYMFYRQFL